tara:strand:- start:164 stop:394 length:231 start_codon:yes stop_codon:yes gene_type:complete
VSAVHDGVCLHRQPGRTHDKRVEHGVEVCEVGAAIDIKVQVRLKVSPEAHLAYEGGDEQAELPPLVVEGEVVERIV